MNTVNQQVLVNHLPNCHPALAVQPSNPIQSLDVPWRELQMRTGGSWHYLIRSGSPVTGAAEV